MNHGSVNRSSDHETLHLVDELCDEFEQQWKLGNRPLIEDYLTKVSKRQRSDLLHELLLLEVDYCRRTGRPLNSEVYLHRFPNHHVLIADILPGVEAPPAELPANTPPDRFASRHADDFQFLADVIVDSRYRPLRLYSIRARDQVCVAFDTLLQREVLVKCLRKEGQGRSENIAILRREAEIMASLRHCALPEVLDVGEDPSIGPYFVMPLYPARSLREVLDTRSLPFTPVSPDFHLATGHSPVRQQAHAASELRIATTRARQHRKENVRFQHLVTVICELAEGIQFAHDHNVTHGNLDGESVWISPDGAVRVWNWSADSETVFATADRPQRRKLKDLAALGGLLDQCIALPSVNGESPESAREVAKQALTSPLGHQLAVLTQVARSAKNAGAVVVQPDLMPNRSTSRPAPVYADVGELVHDLHQWLASEPVSVVKHWPAERRRLRWKRVTRSATTSLPLWIVGVALLVSAAFFASSYWRRFSPPREGSLDVGRDRHERPAKSELTIGVDDSHPLPNVRVEARQVFEDPIKQAYARGDVESVSDTILSAARDYYALELEQWERASPDSLELVQSFVMLARVHHMLGGLATADEFYRRAEESLNDQDLSDAIPRISAESSHRHRKLELHAEVLYGLGRLAEQREQQSLALQYFARRLQVLQQDRTACEDDSIRFHLARAHFDLARHAVLHVNPETSSRHESVVSHLDQATAIFEQMLARNRHAANSQSRNWLGRCYLHLAQACERVGDFASATMALSAAETALIPIEGSQTQMQATQFLLVQVEQQRMRLQHRLGRTGEALSSSRHARDLMNQILQRTSGNTHILELRREVAFVFHGIQMATWALKDAKESLSRARALNATSRSAHWSGEVRLQLDQAQFALWNGDLAEAAIRLEAIEESIVHCRAIDSTSSQDHPDRPRTDRFLGELRMLQGSLYVLDAKEDQAFAKYLEANQILSEVPAEPDEYTLLLHGELSLRIARLYSGRGDVDSALREIQAATPRVKQYVDKFSECPMPKILLGALEVAASRYRAQGWTDSMISELQQKLYLQGRLLHSVEGTPRAHLLRMETLCQAAICAHQAEVASSTEMADRWTSAALELANRVLGSHPNNALAHVACIEVQMTRGILARRSEHSPGEAEVLADVRQSIEESQRKFSQLAWFQHILQTFAELESASVAGE